MKSRPVHIVLLLSLAANAVMGGMLLGSRMPRPPLEADRNERQEPSPRAWRDSSLRRHLELDAEQVEALDRLHLTLNRSLAPKRAELGEKRRQVLALLRQPEPEPTRLDEVFRRMGDLQAAVEQDYALNFLRVKEVLTSEQQVLYFDLLQQKLSSRNDRSREQNPPEAER